MLFVAAMQDVLPELVAMVVVDVFLTNDLNNQTYMYKFDLDVADTIQDLEVDFVVMLKHHSFRMVVNYIDDFVAGSCMVDNLNEHDLEVDNVNVMIFDEVDSMEVVEGAVDLEVVLFDNVLVDWDVDHLDMVLDYCINSLEDCMVGLEDPMVNNQLNYYRNHHYDQNVEMMSLFWRKKQN